MTSGEERCHCMPGHGIRRIRTSRYCWLAGKVLDSLACVPPTWCTSMVRVANAGDLPQIPQSSSGSKIIASCPVPNILHTAETFVASSAGSSSQPSCTRLYNVNAGSPTDSSCSLIRDNNKQQTPPRRQKCWTSSIMLSLFLFQLMHRRCHPGVGPAPSW